MTKDYLFFWKRRKIDSLDLYNFQNTKDIK
jgi:hypothetical protein